MNNNIWWITPYKYLMYIVLPIYLYSGYSKDLFGFNYYYYGLLLILAMIFGAIVSDAQRQEADFSNKKLRANDSYEIKSTKLLLVIFFVSMIGYAVWFWELVLNPSMLIQAASLDTAFTLRGVISTTPGLSSLAQLGVVYVILYSINKYYFKLTVSKKQTACFYLLVLLAGFRAAVWSERLALIEVVVPISIIYVLHAYRGGVSILRILPLVSFVLLFFVFSSFEYFRSWKYYGLENENFLLFMLNRMVAYYTTSVDNGVRYLEIFDPACYSSENFFSMFYRLPVLGEYLVDNFACSQFVYFLSAYADPEFNLISWPLYIASDLGLPITIFLAFIFGVFSGGMCKKMDKSYFYLIFFPVIYIGFLDFLRQGYLHSARMFFIYVGISFVYFSLRNSMVLSSEARAFR